MRRQTNPVHIGNLTIGGTAPVAVQTMCNTATQDVEASLAQCLRLHDAGADVIRLSTQGIKEVEALSLIKSRLRAQGIRTPLVADVHFSPQVAAAAAAVADKLRINPGNFAPNAAEGRASFINLLELCRQHRTALRIGVNHGSLGADALSRFGNTPQGMSYLAMQWLTMCKEADFDQVVVSMKSSNTGVMAAAYRQLVADMDAQGMTYPLHLGVTEAGNGREGRMKAAVAMAALLHQGLGDTIRVSLTEPPENEIPVGRAIVDYVQNHPLPRPASPALFSYRLPSMEALTIAAACEIGPLLLDQKISDVVIDAEIKGKKLHAFEVEDFIADLLQAARRRFSKPEYIACPGCGRTLFDLEKTLAEVKAHTAHLKGLSIAVMGCIVNGPGEMADAHYGYVGAGKGKVTLYRGKEPVLHAIPQEEAVAALLRLIQEDLGSDKAVCAMFSMRPAGESFPSKTNNPSGTTV
ncbi:MAG: (E)-4-hydroxy-3-methylbut-2-enyl-diphosphate synthase [Bacteroidales bacterium]|nr:(E)-4-hydroxy-3-methylbut-2-enyl-diphosphate synthase [Bacteroidales bacterium]